MIRWKLESKAVGNDRVAWSHVPVKKHCSNMTPWNMAEEGWSWIIEVWETHLSTEKFVIFVLPKSLGPIFLLQFYVILQQVFSAMGDASSG